MSKVTGLEDRSMSSLIKIYLGENHDSWDEDGWIWFLASRDEAFCVVRVTPHEYLSLQERTAGFLELIRELQRLASNQEPKSDPQYRNVYSVGSEPTDDPTEVIPDWMASLHYLANDRPGSRGDWQASGPARQMISKALTWNPERFRGAVLVTNAGLKYGPEKIHAIAETHSITAVS
jgi:hypothetical protein